MLNAEGKVEGTRLKARLKYDASEESERATGAERGPGPRATV
jgi:hypothetical protein